MRAVIVALLLLSGCTDSELTKKALDGAGYTDIKVGGYGFMSCSQDDVYSTKFQAKGPSGKPVSGVVCAGLFKGSTIRTN